MYETGGTVNESGVYTTQEAGLELIDTMSPTQLAYSLANAARGELTYIPANSKVTNAAMTTLKMKSMIDEEMKSMVNLYMTEFKKELLTIMKGNSGNGDFNVTMNNPNFVDKGSENANINNIKRIIKSMK
jgi:23S rRNA A1618 N6-methylase RlmF